MPVSRSLVQAFYQAYARRDVAAVLEFIADDIDWKFLGPVDIFPFCGHRRGKAAVIDHFSRLLPTRFAVRRLEPEELVIDGDSVASFSKITSVENGTGRVMTYHCAHFLTFRDGKVVRMQAVADTFGVLEQMSTLELVVGEPEMSQLHSGIVPAQTLQHMPGGELLSGPVPPWVRAFYEAYASCDAQRLDALLDEEVNWLISGPADYVDFFGPRYGKAAVIELITRIMPCYEQLGGFDIEQLLVQGDSAASFGRVCARQRETGRSLRFGYAHFMRFRDGKLIAFRALADSFDAVSQIMGCRIVTPLGADLVPAEPDGDLAVV
jgi:ketosteroid isomerase-like protein